MKNECEMRNDAAGKKLAVFFPGIGYTCHKPLLYYTIKLAAAAGFEIRTVDYGGFETNIRGNRQKMEAAFYSALTQSEEILKDIDWASYEDILFVSKSVGTIVAAAYLKKYQIPGRSVSYTPLTDTFTFAQAGEGIFFHGTADPWAPDTKAIQKGCDAIGQTLYLTEGANHSLETGDVIRDVENLKGILERVKAFLLNCRL